MRQDRQSSNTKAVVVHRGARDAYQVARALSEAGLLQALVTDLYWPQDNACARVLSRVLPSGLQGMLRARFAQGLPSSEVKLCLPSGPFSFLLDKLPRVSSRIRQKAQRHTDAALGRMSGRIAEQTNAKLLSYSYYGYHAFSTYCRPGILFQVHPHPVSVRKLLQQELEAHPECRASLEKEWELALPDEDFRTLTAETEMAAHFLCASSFTRKTLIENGAPENLIDVIPYGIDLERFHPGQSSRDTGRPFRLLFVGTINQRKGIKYLLEALRLLRSKNIHLTVCGRVVDDLKIFEPFASQIDIRPSVSSLELLRAYQEADLFVFPSIVEGFAQVLLESLACGLPILSTTHTAAPDLIEDGIHGFVVEPRRPDLLAEKVEWLIDHPSQLQEMGHAARQRAELFTWQRFRDGVVRSVRSFEPLDLDRQERVTQYV